MSLERLLEQRKIKQLNATKDEVEDILSLSERDIKMAEFAVSQNWDWAFSIAYNSCLQASRAYMHSKGYRALNPHAHKNTFLFMKDVLGDKYGKLISFLDRIRTKRNRAVYDISGLITETEVKELLKHAKKYLEIIKTEISD